MTLFRRGRHRRNKFSVTVADVRASLVGEYLPTGQRIGPFNVMRHTVDGRECYQWSGTVTVPQSWDPAVMMVMAPDVPVSIPVLGGVQ
jgi:hypothetical protein